MKKDSSSSSYSSSSRGKTSPETGAEGAQGGVFHWGKRSVKILLGVVVLGVILAGAAGLQWGLQSSRMNSMGEGWQFWNGVLTLFRPSDRYPHSGSGGKQGVSLGWGVDQRKRAEDLQQLAESLNYGDDPYETKRFVVEEYVPIWREPAMKALWKGKVCKEVESDLLALEKASSGESPAIQQEKIIQMFEDSQARLLLWLKRNENQFSHSDQMRMKKRVEEARLNWASQEHLPDLMWREIVIWNESHSEDQVEVTVSPRFEKLIRLQPRRAQFEMTRALAQSWAPCQMHPDQPVTIWTEYLNCMGMIDSGSCHFTSYSEAGWAISSALASVVAGPGCVLPAFTTGMRLSCLKKVAPLEKKMSSILSAVGARRGEQARVDRAPAGRKKFRRAL